MFVLKQFMNSIRLFVYLIVYEFRYQGRLLTRKCPVFQELMNAPELF